MAYTPNDLHLSLTPEQTVALKKSYTDFVKRIHDRQTVTPEYAAQLQNQLATVLKGQKTWQGITQQSAAFNHQLVHLIHTENDVLALPWHIATTSNDYLHISKGFGREADNFEPEKLLPLKILIVIAAPDDLNDAQRLDHETEVESIIEAFQPLIADALVELDFANDGTLATLTEKLRDNAYHILHFSGHGVYSDTAQDGFLLMEDDSTYLKRMVSGKDFVRILTQIPDHCPELVLLSACQSAQGFDSITKTLLLAGVPAVVSMNVSIFDY